MSEPLVPLKHSLKQANKFQTISDKILLNLKESIPDIESQKLSVELIEYVCNLIELYVKHSYKLNKENLFIFTLKRVVNLSDDETEFIKKTIQYLHDNKLIKKITSITKGLNLTKSALKKKFVPK